MNNNDYLAHYGVKGMKWGVRHDPERVGRIKKKASGTAKSIGRGTKNAATKAKPIAKKVGKGAKVTAKYAFGPTRYAEGHRRIKQRRLDRSEYGKAKKMTDKELRDRINRINLEQSYLKAVQTDNASRKAATQSVLVKYGTMPVTGTVKYASSVVNNKEFKGRVAKTTAKMII